MPRALSALARRRSSRQKVLPPSMIVSPGDSSSPRRAIVASVASPAGSMTQTARGASRRETTSARSRPAVAPSRASAPAADASWSKATTAWPLRIRRRARLAPMRPSPIIPICMDALPAVEVNCGRRARRPRDSGRSDPHRHQDVERALRVLVLDERRRAGIGEPQDRDLAFDLRRDVEQIARVEADIERLGLVIDLELFGGAAGVR